MPGPCAGGTWTPRAGGFFIEDVERFDAERFRIEPAEAAAMDPQQRLFLTVAAEARERAVGSDGSGVWGVFVGAGQQAYLEVLLPHVREGAQALPAGTLPGNLLNMLAGRVAHVLDLRGPALTVDTACSSSLVALHLACQSIRAGDCTAAIVGGVHLNLSDSLATLMRRAGALSPSGRCTPFESTADGTVLGEGAVAVVVMERAEAERRGLPVLALLRGSAINNDGASLGVMAPNPAGQEAVLRRALSIAGVEAAAVRVVEAHGTATRVGDAVEQAVLQRVYPHGPRRTASKALFGHLMGAAGLAGLVRLLGELSPGELGAVSAFGFGGTNAHVVVEGAWERVPAAALADGENRGARHWLAPPSGLLVAGAQVVITGATGALGRALVGRLAPLGLRLVLTGSRPPDAEVEALLAATRAAGSEAQYVAADLTTLAGSPGASGALSAPPVAPWTSSSTSRGHSIRRRPRRSSSERSIAWSRSRRARPSSPRRSRPRSRAWSGASRPMPLPTGRWMPTRSRHRPPSGSAASRFRLFAVGEWPSPSWSTSAAADSRSSRSRRGRSGCSKHSTWPRPRRTAARRHTPVPGVARALSDVPVGAARRWPGAAIEAAHHSPHPSAPRLTSGPLPAQKRLDPDEVEHAVRQLLAEAMGCDAKTLDAQQTFPALGLDSLAAIEVVKRLEALVGRPLPDTLLYERDTLERLLDALLSPVGASPPATRLEPREVPGGHAAGAASRESVDEGRALLPAQLTFVTQRVFAPEMPGNVFLAVTVENAGDLLSPAALEPAVLRLAERHPALRSVIRGSGVKAVQVEGPPPDVRFVPSIDAAMEDALADELFDLERGPLFRIVTDGRRLVLNGHHAVVDAWSVRNVLLELGILLAAGREGRPVELPALGSTVDQAQAALAQPAEASALQWFRERLAGAPPLHLAWRAPVDLPSSGGAAVVHRKLEAERTEAIRQRARDAGVTLPAWGLAAWMLAVFDATGQHDVVIRMAHGRRSARIANLDRLVGCFAEALPVRAEVRPGDCTADVARRVQTFLTEQQRHAPDVSAVALAGALPRGSGGFQSASPFAFSFPLLPGGAEVDGLQLTDVVARAAAGTTRVTLVAFLVGDLLHLSLNHARSHVAPADAARLLASFERHLGDEAPQSAAGTLHGRVLARCRAHPERIAIGDAVLRRPRPALGGPGCPARRGERPARRGARRTRSGRDRRAAGRPARRGGLRPAGSALAGCPGEPGARSRRRRRRW